jgi:hypothetical protein
MNKYRLLFSGLTIGTLLIFGFLLIGYIQNGLAEASVTNPSDAVITETPSSIDGSDEVLPANLNEGIAAPDALPTPIPGETLVYFSTTDSDATATVVYLYNTDSVVHTVALRGYSYSGVLGYSLNINVPASSLIRLSSDLIAANPPPSWATPAPIITNFTDFTYFASLSLPHGVRAEGYFLYNHSTGTVDPRLDQGAIPIRFSTDPVTLFMPSVSKNP